MLVALNCGACYVVGEKWLEDSAKQSAPIDIPLSPQPGTLASPVAAAGGGKKGGRASKGRGGAGSSDRGGSYLVQDKDKEKKWAPFILLDTLARNFQRRHSTSGSGSGSGSDTGALLFAGMGVFIASDVFGNKAPLRDEMRLIVESGGGCFLVRGKECLLARLLD